MIYGVMGDAHNGFKAYNSDRRTEEVLLSFEAGLNILADQPVVLFAGDFFDDTNVPNFVKRALIRLKESEKFYDQIWVIDGGNHDSTKTYSSTSALDVFSEVHNVVVVNSFKIEELEIRGIKCLAIPHMRSQQNFLAAIDAWLELDHTVDVILMHCLVDSSLDLSPNDLNLDSERLGKLRGRCANMFIGHQHDAAEVAPGVWIPGGILEFDFGQLGDKYVYTVEDGKVSAHTLPVPRPMLRMEIPWSSALALIETFNDLPEDAIVRVDITDIPVDEYSLAKSVCDAAEDKYAGVLLPNLYKTGHRQLHVTAIDARLDIQEEFGVFLQENEVEAHLANAMQLRLEDSIGQVLAEEE